MRYLTILAGLSASTVLLAADATIVEEIICRVNGDIITRKDLENTRKELPDVGRQQGLIGAKLEEFVNTEQPNILRNRIDDLLMVQKGKELEIKVDPDVNKRIAEIQRESKISDPDKFQELVRKETGKSYEDFKAELKDQYLKQAIMQGEVIRKITFKTEELRAYYDAHLDQFQRDERVFLREILVANQGKENDPVAMAVAEKKAIDLVARARKGEKFPEMAQANSDATTAKDGGTLDPATKGLLAPEIEVLVWDKEKNYVTDPIKIPGGWLILKVDEHHKAGLADFEEVQGTIQNFMMQSRLEPAARAYLTKLRQDAFLEIKAGFEDTGAAPSKNTTWTDPALLKPETISKKEVLEKGAHRKLLGVIPLPGTTHTGTSSSR
jgi:peptidyl-prolyl cis-trans isomerase SurA